MIVVPQPSHAELTGSKFAVDSSLSIVGEPAKWLSDQLATLANLAVVGGGPEIRFEIGEVPGKHAVIGRCADGADPSKEAYRIEITSSGVRVVGVSDEALFRAATTLLHLIVQHRDGLPTGLIGDSPRFAWRGLSLDVVRCFHPVKTVKKVIDLLALYKFNVLHLHLTDTEGWRFTVPRWPLLTEVSGQTARDGRSGGWYSPSEFAEIVRYAADRFITVVPEFDSPGHTASVLAAYPELATNEIREMPPAMQYLHPDQPQVEDLLRDVYSAMAEATSTSAFLHVGGDEAIAMEHEAFTRFIQMALPIARETGKGVVAWQEAARGGLSAGDVLQYWIPPHLIEQVKRARETGDFQGMDPDDPVTKAFIELFSIADQDVQKGLDQGADILLSPATWFYLDTKYVEESIDSSQNELQQRLGLPQRVYGNGTVKQSYEFDPMELVSGIDPDRVVGVEAALWCETITGKEDVFFQLLPRLAGVAEKAWSQPMDWNDYQPRLIEQPRIWDAMGLPWFRSSVVWDS